MSTKAAAKSEFLVINIGSGVQPGSTVTVIGVTDSSKAAMDMIKKMGVASVGKILVAEKMTVVSRTPVVQLTESDESVLAGAK